MVVVARRCSAMAAAFGWPQVRPSAARLVKCLADFATECLAAERGLCAGCLSIAPSRTQCAWVFSLPGKSMVSRAGSF